MVVATVDLMEFSVKTARNVNEIFKFSDATFSMTIIAEKHSVCSWKRFFRFRNGVSKIFSNHFLYLLVHSELILNFFAYIIKFKFASVRDNGL